MKRFSIYLLLMAAFSLSLVGCKDDEDPKYEGSDINMHMHYFYDGEAFDASKEYCINCATGANQRVRFDAISMILSDLTIVYADNTEQLLEDSYRIADAHEGETEILRFGKYVLDEKDIVGLKFSIGLNPTWNSIDPIVELDEDHELYRADMHWGWNPAAGYKFMRFEGEFFERNDPPDSMRTFAYHIAKDENLVAVNTFEATAPEASADKTADDGHQHADGLTWHVNFDVKRIFENINFETETTTHSSPDKQPLTDKVRSNAAAAFSAE